jgi:hypothetical protein
VEGVVGVVRVVDAAVVVWVEVVGLGGVAAVEEPVGQLLVRQELQVVGEGCLKDFEGAEKAATDEAL